MVRTNGFVIIVPHTTRTRAQAPPPASLAPRLNNPCQTLPPTGGRRQTHSSSSLNTPQSTNANNSTQKLVKSLAHQVALVEQQQQVLVALVLADVALNEAAARALGVTRVEYLYCVC